MQKIRQFVILPLLTLFAITTLSSCGGDGAESGAIRVGSKDFAEQFILGEMYALVLEAEGFPVERKLNLGGTQVTHESLKSGEIDLYPEYTGTGLITILKRPRNSDSQEVYDIVSQEYAQQFNLEWLKPAPMNNTYALFMTPEDAQQYGIETISDIVPQASELKMVGTYEFQGRPDGLSGLKQVYGDFKLAEYKAVNAALRYQALAQDQADIAVGFATDGEVSALNLVRLEDDKNFFPPYEVAPVVRQDVLEENPEIAQILNELSAKITDEAMQRLNYQVTGKQREPGEVAKEFLIEQGFLESNN